MLKLTVNGPLKLVFGLWWSCNTRCCVRRVVLPAFLTCLWCVLTWRRRPDPVSVSVPSEQGQAGGRAPWPGRGGAAGVRRAPGGDGGGEPQDEGGGVGGAGAAPAGGGAGQQGEGGGAGRGPPTVRKLQRHDATRETGDVCVSVSGGVNSNSVRWIKAALQHE